MEIRIGVHLGDVIVQDYRVYGDGVNIAARLQTVADPGSICISEAVYQQVYTKVDLAFEDLGVRELKNIEHPIRIWWLVIGGIVVTAVGLAQLRPLGKSQPGNPR
jgi:adenylate cyclase